MRCCESYINCHSQRRSTFSFFLLLSSISRLSSSSTFFFIHISGIGMYVIRFVCPAVQSSIFNVGHYKQALQPNSFMHAVHVGTIACYWCFVLFGLVWFGFFVCFVFWVFFFSLQFQWPRPWMRVTRSAESKTSWLHFLAYLSTDRDEICGVEAVHVERHDNAL